MHPKVVSEMLGHSSIAITPDIYSHVIPGPGDAAASARGDVLGDEPGVGGEETQGPLADRISAHVMRASGQ